MKDIEKMNGEEFQDLMNFIKTKDRLFYKLIITNHFSYYKGKRNPIIKAWNDDCDDVWDAEATVVRYVKVYSHLQAILDEYDKMKN